MNTNSALFLCITCAGNKIKFCDQVEESVMNRLRDERYLTPINIVQHPGVTKWSWSFKINK